MLPYVASAIVGAVLMGRTKPKTKMRRLQVFGPKTGTVYTVEEAEDTGCYIVHAPDSSVGIFQKTGIGPFTFLWGKGSEATIAAMQKDLLP